MISLSFTALLENYGSVVKANGMNSEFWILDRTLKYFGVEFVAKASYTDVEEYRVPNWKSVDSIHTCTRTVPV